MKKEKEKEENEDFETSGFSRSVYIKSIFYLDRRVASISVELFLPLAALIL